MPDLPRTRRCSLTPIVAVLLVLAAVATACSTDGRTLAEPDPQLTATTPVTTAVPTTAAPPLALTSPAFDTEGTLPVRFTCNGADISPPLSLSSVPGGTESLAIALTDPDASGFVHWVLTGIDPATTALRADTVPRGAVEYPNDFGDADYQGPCPPAGEQHRYAFTLYAVPPSAAALVGPDETNGQAVIDLLATLASTTAVLNVSYQAPGD